MFVWTAMQVTPEFDIAQFPLEDGQIIADYEHTIIYDDDDRPAWLLIRLIIQGTDLNDQQCRWLRANTLQFFGSMEVFYYADLLSDQEIRWADILPKDFRAFGQARKVHLYTLSRQPSKSQSQLQALVLPYQATITKKDNGDNNVSEC